MTYISLSWVHEFASNLHSNAVGILLYSLHKQGNRDPETVSNFSKLEVRGQAKSWSIQAQRSCSFH